MFTSRQGSCWLSGFSTALAVAALVCLTELPTLAQFRPSEPEEVPGQILPQRPDELRPPPLIGDAPDSVSIHEEIILNEAASTFSSGKWLFSGGWYAQAEAVVLLKTKLNEIPLAFDATIGGSPIVLTTTTDAPTYEPGTRLAVGHMLGRDAWNRDHMLEFRLLAPFQWQAQARAVRTFDGIPALGIQTLLGPNTGDVAALHGNTSQRYINESHLDAYEVNYRFRTRSSRDRMVLQHDGHWIRHSTSSRIWSGYAGVAKIAVDERFDLLGLGPETQSGHYVVMTSNDLVGIQFGGEYIEQSTFWYWGLRGRLGGLANFADRRSRFDSTVDPIGDEGPTTTRRSELSSKSNMALLIEGGFFAAFQVHPNLSVRAGYDFLYITGLAEATGNLGLPVDNFPPLRATDDPLYHGGSVGLTAVW